jgi:hypothetical protein
VNCKDVIASYLGFLKEGFSCLAQEDGRLSIVLPYLYPDHDNIELFVKEVGTKVTVHDFGETLRSLSMTGMDLNSSDRMAFLVSKVSKGYGVTLEDGVLLKSGTPSQVGELVFDVLSVCKYVSSLAFAGRSYQPLTFHKQVENLFQRTGLPYDSNVPQTGFKTGTIYKIDYKVVTKKKSSYIQAQQARSEAGIHAWVNDTHRMWEDIKPLQGGVVAKNITLLNDEDTVIKDVDVKWLETVSDVHYWSERQRFLEAIEA